MLDALVQTSRKYRAYIHVPSIYQNDFKQAKNLIHMEARSDKDFSVWSANGGQHRRTQLWMGLVSLVAHSRMGSDTNCFR